MGKSGLCLVVSCECTEADPLHKLSYLILLVHGYIFVLFFLKITKCDVICKQRVCVFHQGIQTQENGMKHEREARVFYCFRVFGPLVKHEKRVVYITSQTKTFHWLFNLLSVIKILIVVF